MIYVGPKHASPSRLTKSFLKTKLYTKVWKFPIGLNTGALVSFRECIGLQGHEKKIPT